MTDEYVHDFNCKTGCMLCIRCGMHMAEALESDARCADRIRRHPHPLPERTKVPYVPIWAVPLSPVGG